jgi:SAM-dependent methyltransferase
MESLYTNKFYEQRDHDTSYAANKIINYLSISKWPRSVIDIGCGVGTWLKVFKEKGSYVQGLEGPWINRDHLVIEQSEVLSCDLSMPPDLARKFDFAICLEVAEHIQPDYARDFIRRVGSYADKILFSAAIPFQGGVGHVNEQWPNYWAQMFYEEGFCCSDYIRDCIWTDDKIPVWYRQNILFFNKLDRLPYYRPRAMVHPDLFIQKARPKYVNEAWHDLKSAIKNKVKL